MAQLNISIPPALKSWIDYRVAEGRYSSASDYLRHLVRRDQDAAKHNEPESFKDWEAKVAVNFKKDV